MYLAQLEIQNFRRLAHVCMKFQPGLNIIVGPNNVGKTAVIDSLRTLLVGPDEYPLRLYVDDIYRSSTNVPATSSEILFKFVFKDLSLDDEADFLPALVRSDTGALEAHISISYSNPGSDGRLRPKRWCGVHEDVGFTPEMMENLRGIYLPPLRDASQGLHPSKTSQLARLLHLLADDKGKSEIDEVLKIVDEELKKQKPITATQTAVSDRHTSMLGQKLAQNIAVGLSASDFQKMSARLSLSVDDLEIDRNGLGFNNLIYMAVVLSELSRNPDAAYRGLIVEEPEAHLHPQLQAVLLKYLEEIHKTSKTERSIQVFVTSHSPNFASIARLDTLVCLTEFKNKIGAFFPREIEFEPGKREKLERFLDATRAELFFARRIIFVEGAAELILLPVLAKKIGYDLRKHGVSVISVEGLNFDSFFPLFGEEALKVPVSMMTDADPQGLYPKAGDEPIVSDNTKKMLGMQNEFLKVFHGLKTFEYDLALDLNTCALMLKALEEIHPQIATRLTEDMSATADSNQKAKILFCGLFERENNNVQKGKFGQALAQVLADSEVSYTVPKYIRLAIEHACNDA